MIEQELIEFVGNAIVEALIKTDFECSHMTDVQRDAMARAALTALSDYARKMGHDD
jgi:hypothetical protein